MIEIVLALAAVLQDGLGVDEFQKLHARLQPPKEEPWRGIPWITSLAQGRIVAAREKKPIFMWSMDGTPLGCG